MNSETSQNAERQWYVVYTKPQKEEYAKLHLQSKGLEVFFPRLLLPETLKQRRKVVPFFPNYLFARLNLLSDEYYWATWSPGVNRLVSFDGQAVPLDDTAIQLLKQKADNQGMIQARSNLKVGQEIRVANGPLEGLLGIIEEPPSPSGRVKVLLKLLNRQMKVEMPLHLVNGSWVASDLSVH